MQESANKLLPVAKVLKSFGTDGGILIRIASEAKNKINKKRPVFIYFDGLPVPFFISEIESKGTEKFILKLDNIDTLELASEVEGELIYTEQPIETKGKNKKSEFSPADLVGMRVYNTDNILLGEISNFYDYPGNPCISLKSVIKEGESLIPLHEDFISSIDFKNNKLVLLLPDGILDI
ncbi:MAG: ribosome maturation factor RimM [Bacteroidales bacterium]|nr:ribosome maturation factor RimM [Bacteroidales bacterium]